MPKSTAPSIVEPLLPADIAQAVSFKRLRLQFLQYDDAGRAACIERAKRQPHDSVMAQLLMRNVYGPELRGELEKLTAWAEGRWTA